MIDDAGNNEKGPWTLTKILGIVGGVGEIEFYFGSDLNGGCASSGI